MTKTKKKSAIGTQKKTSTKQQQEEHAQNARVDALINEIRASIRTTAANTIEHRKELLATVAGTVAVGLMNDPSPLIETPSTLATVAVDIAEEILKKAGILTSEASAGFGAENATPSDASVDAVS